MYGRLEDGIVTETTELDMDRFGEWILLPEGVSSGWSFADDVWTAPAEPEPVVEPPKPIALTKLQFVRLCKSAGGMTSEQHIAATKDPLLEEMWIMFNNYATDVEKDDEDTLSGLGALEALTYLPNGAQAVLDAWPTE